MASLGFKAGSSAPWGKVKHDDGEVRMKFFVAKKTRSSFHAVSHAPRFRSRNRKD